MTDLTPLRALGQDPPPASAATLVEVQRRARHSVLRRRLAVATAAALVVGGGVVAAVAGDPRTGSDSLFVDQPLPTPPPGCATFACPEKEQAPGPDCEDGRFDYCPDGRPGWSTGLTSCVVTDALDSSEGTRPPAPGVSMRLEVVETSVPAGTPAPARVVVRNDGRERVRFSVLPTPTGHSFEVRALGPGGGNVRHGSDVGQQVQFDLDPGEADVLPLIVPTVTCADTYGRAEPPLVPGRYDVSLRLVWFQAVVGDPTVQPAMVAHGFWTGTAELQVTP